MSPEAVFVLMLLAGSTGASLGVLLGLYMDRPR